MTTKKQTPRPLPKRWRWMVLTIPLSAGCEDAALFSRRADAREHVRCVVAARVGCVLIDLHHPDGPMIVEEVEP